MISLCMLSNNEIPQDAYQHTLTLTFKCSAFRTPMQIFTPAHEQLNEYRLAQLRMTALLLSSTGITPKSALPILLLSSAQLQLLSKRVIPSGHIRIYCITVPPEHCSQRVDCITMPPEHLEGNIFY